MLPMAVMTLLLSAVACNEKSDTPETQAVSDASVAITGFSLKANSDIAPRLDSVFFSIDLDNAVVFNADSLPAGTRVTALIPIISFPSEVSEATIIMEDGEKRTGEIDYIKHPSDSVDFSGKVSLKLTAKDGTTTRTYRLKMNVHQMVSDTLAWDKLGETSLPALTAAPQQQKTVIFNDMAYCMVREGDGSVSLSVSAEPGPDSWTTTSLPGAEAMDVRSFTATDNKFYILDGEGNLLSSDDALSWRATGQNWLTITGGFGATLLGVASQEGQLYHVSYPANYEALPLEEDFPVEGASNFGVFANRWSRDPMGILVGGIDNQGERTNATWAFDGYSWAKLSDAGPGACSEGALVKYTIYRRTSLTSYNTEEFTIWLYIGGKDAEGKNSRRLWMTYDNGVNWYPAVDYMRLPEEVPALRSLDAISLTVSMSADMADYWKKIPSRPLGPRAVKHSLDGQTLNWECPYIFLFGGFTDEGAFNPAIYRGVINYLTFTPII